MSNKAGSKESQELTAILERAARFFSSTKGYILTIRREPLYNDEPKLFHYSAFYKTSNNLPDNVASGVSFNKYKALVRVSGEAIERYCLDNFNERDLTRARIADLNRPFLNPAQVVSFSQNQLLKKSFQRFIIKDSSRFRWLEGRSLPSERKVLIPAQLVFTSYHPIKDEPLIRLPISTGAASSTSFEDAMYRGICEVVERDAFMISYLNKLHSPMVDLNSTKDDDIAHILHIFEKYKLELAILNITTDIQIPAFAAIVLDKTGAGPAVSVGLKAGFNVKNVIIGAIEESLMVRSWLRDRFIYSKSSYKLPKVIRTIEDRAYFWFKPDAIRYLDFWLKNNSSKRLNLRSKLPTKISEFQQAITVLKKAGMDFFYVDITHSKMKEFGFRVVKVVIPQLQPLYLDERYPYFGGTRLYEVPVKLGYCRNIKVEEHLNKIPHPFL